MNDYKGYILWLLLGMVHLRTLMADDSNEFCRWESFNASCPHDSVVRITSARYGRMRLGRCMTRDYLIGCHADVTPQADELCSGRRKCVIAVPNPSLHEIQPCPKDLGAYFEADYECVKVQTGSDELCHAFKPLVVNTPVGYLSNVVTAETGYGTGYCPWKIHLSEGQRLNLTLYDYSARRLGSQDVSRCPVYATIQEGDRGKSATVCGGQERVRRIFTSTSNQVEINIVNRGTETPDSYFLIKYEVLGCAAMAPPVGGYVKRTGQTLEVACNGSSEKWHLVCRGIRWVGTFKNCSGGGSAWGFDRILQDTNTFPFGLVVSIVIGIILGVIIGTSLLALVLHCRRRRINQLRRKALLECNSPNYTATRTDSGYGSSNPKFHTMRSAHAPKTDSAYTHMWESRANFTDNGASDPHCFTFPRNGVIPVSVEAKEASSNNPYPPRNGNHIYESPKFSRKEVVPFEDRAFYHEFDSSLEGQESSQVDLNNFMSNCNASGPR